MVQTPPLQLLPKANPANVPSFAQRSSAELFAVAKPNKVPFQVKAKAVSRLGATSSPPGTMMLLSYVKLPIDAVPASGPSNAVAVNVLVMGVGRAVAANARNATVAMTIRLRARFCWSPCPRALFSAIRTPPMN